jgi:hypothetical protein
MPATGCGAGAGDRLRALRGAPGRAAAHSQTLLTLAAAGLAAAAPALFGAGYRSTCAVGFSGVLFALKVAVSFSS